MSDSPEYIGVELAAKKLGIGKGHLQTTLKKCPNYPGVFKVPGSSVVLVDPTKLDGIKKLFPKLNRPQPVKPEPLPEGTVSLAQVKELIQEEFSSVKALMLEVRSSVKEGIKVSVDDSNYGLELQNAINQMNNRVTDNNQTSDNMRRIMVRLETKLHNFIEQFIDTHCDDGQAKTIRKNMTAREQKNASHQLMQKFNSNHN